MGEGLAKQAKTLTAQVATHRYPERDRVIVLLSVKAGLRAKEVAMGHGDGRQGQGWRRATPSCVMR
jgi:hypothetical protein